MCACVCSFVCVQQGTSGATNTFDGNLWDKIDLWDNPIKLTNGMGSVGHHRSNGNVPHKMCVYVNHVCERVCNMQIVRLDKSHGSYR